MKQLTLLSCLFLFAFTANAQLQGKYLIGDSTLAHFATVEEGLRALQSKGGTGNIIFQLLPDTYSGFQIDSIPSLVNGATLTIESLNHDSSEVVLKSFGTSVVMLMQAYNVTLKDLTLWASSGFCIEAKWVRHCQVHNCLLLTPHHKGAVYDDVAVMVNNRFNNSSANELSFINCELAGSSSGFRISGYQGKIVIDNCRVMTTGRYAVSTSWLNGFSITNTELHGEFDISRTSGESFINNVVYGTGDFAFTTISHNYFVEPGNYELGSDHITGNRINGNVRLTQGGTLDSNRINGALSGSHIGHCDLRYNVIKGKVSFGYTDGLFALSNELGGISTSFQSYYFQNNLCYGNASFSFGSGKVYHNNFKGHASLSDQGVRVSGNNFSGGTSISALAHVAYNNYYPGLGAADKAPYYYDPQYKSDSELVAQNPLLVGKGEKDLVQIDVNGNARDVHPTLGPHEFCLSDFSTHGNFDLPCGETLQLKNCHAPKGAVWVSGANLSDTLGVAPYIEVLKTNAYYLVDGLGHRHDSVLVRVQGFGDIKQEDVQLGCNEQVQLKGRYHAKAQYMWTPGTGLSDSTSRSPKATPTVTTRYIKSVQIPGCATYFDTVLVERFDDPKAYAQFMSRGDTVTFINESLCSDSVKWKFDDGYTSTQHRFDRYYTKDGEFSAVLYAFGGSDVDTFNFWFFVSTGVDRAQTLPVKLYPNPTRGLVQVDNPENLDLFVSVYNTQGQLVKTIDQPASTFKIANQPGVYLVVIKSHEGVLHQRLVVE